MCNKKIIFVTGFLTGIFLFVGCREAKQAEPLDDSDATKYLVKKEEIETTNSIRRDMVQNNEKGTCPYLYRQQNINEEERTWNTFIPHLNAEGS